MTCVIWQPLQLSAYYIVQTKNKQIKTMKTTRQVNTLLEYWYCIHDVSCNIMVTTIWYQNGIIKYVTVKHARHLDCKCKYSKANWMTGYFKFWTLLKKSWKFISQNIMFDYDCLVFELDCSEFKMSGSRVSCYFHCRR